MEKNNGNDYSGFRVLGLGFKSPRFWNEKDNAVGGMEKNMESRTSMGIHKAQAVGDS